MYKYIPLAKTDLPVIIKFYKEFLNGGRGVEEHLNQAIVSKEYFGIKCIDLNGEICGIFSAYKGIEFTCAHFDLVEKLEHRYKNKNIYTLDMMAVLPEHRNEGIAYELGLKLKDMLLEKKAELLMAELWRQPDGKLPGKVILDSIGHEIEHNYYPGFYTELEKYELSCPICGVPCICGADICILDLEYIKSEGEI